MRKKLPKSIRKHIRREKARIRREVFGVKEQETLIAGLYTRFFPKEGYRKEPDEKKIKTVKKTRTGGKKTEESTASKRKPRAKAKALPGAKTSKTMKKQ